MTLVDSRPRDPGSRSDNTAELRRLFLKRVHQLVCLGYQRLDARAYRMEEEPAITGDLAEAIDGVLDGPEPEDWMRFYFVADDPPVNEPRRRGPKDKARRKGKHRRRVDIRVVSSEQRPRTRFCFEAKRLGKNNSVAKYLGYNGLERFLRGEYARSEDEAGMLGYVQSGDPTRWAAAIASSLDESWQPCPLAEGLDHTYRSSHQRQRPARRIEIYHTLLRFV